MMLAHFAPRPEVEDEFGRWYDDIHVPEREALPGFGRVQRYVESERDAEGRAALLTLYEVDGAWALQTPEYLALGVDPYMADVLAGSTRFYRIVADRAGDDDAAWPSRPTAVTITRPPSDEPAPAGAVATARFVVAEANVEVSPTIAVHALASVDAASPAYRPVHA